VAWVRIVLTNDSFGEDRQNSHAMVVPADHSACQAVVPAFSENQPCILYTKDNAQTADFTIVLNEEIVRFADRKGVFYKPIGTRTATAYLGADLGDKPIFYQRQFFHNSLKTGLSKFALSHTGTATDPRSVSAPIDFPTDLERIGITLGKQQSQPTKVRSGKSANKALQPPRPQDTAYIVSMLASGPESRNVFSDGFSQSLRDWYDRVSVKETITDTEANILCSLPADWRIKRKPSEKELFGRFFYLTCQ
jgi:hypothetical protein